MDFITHLFRLLVIYTSHYYLMINLNTRYINNENLGQKYDFTIYHTNDFLKKAKQLKPDSLERWRFKPGEGLYRQELMKYPGSQALQK